VQFRLILDGDSSKAQWLVEWDDTNFVLHDPNGQAVFEAETFCVHRVVDFYELYAKGRISFTTPSGPLKFQKNDEALEDLLDLVDTGLRGDSEYRDEIRRQSRRGILLGIGMFVIAGGLFGLYCWFASWAPPPGNWFRWFRWLIHGVLLFLLAAAFAGPFVAYDGLRQGLLIRRIEWAAQMNDNPGTEDPKDSASG
jgi:hypothetical protein